MLPAICPYTNCTDIVEGVVMKHDVQAPFTVSQMRKFADKLRNFSTTPTPESKPSKGHHHRRHSTLSASAAHSSGAHTPAASSSVACDSATPDSSWAANLLSPKIAPQKLLGQFGSSPHPQGTAKIPGHATKHHRHHHAGTTPAVAATNSELHIAHPAVADVESAMATTDAAAATAGLRQGSEGQMMLLPAGVAMNDLLALAEEMDPGGSPGEGKKGRRDKRMLTANSTMQLAAYLAGKVSPQIIFPVRTGHVAVQQQCPCPCCLQRWKRCSMVLQNDEHETICNAVSAV